MKCFHYNLNQTDISTFFPKKLIKNKVQIIQILLEFIRQFLLIPDKKPTKKILLEFIMWNLELIRLVGFSFLVKRNIIRFISLLIVQYKMIVC